MNGNTNINREPARGNRQEIQQLGRSDIVLKLVGTIYDEPMQVVMKVTGYCSTRSRHLGAYSGTLMDNPIVILNEAMLNVIKDEFTVTVLHELLHLINTPGDGDPTSEDEAMHDLQCYSLLFGTVPADHWAFVKYPHLMDVLRTGE